MTGGLATCVCIMFTNRCKRTNENKSHLRSVIQVRQGNTKLKQMNLL